MGEVGVTERIVVEMGQREKGVNLLVKKKKKSFRLHYKAPLMTEELNSNIVRLGCFSFHYGAAELLKRPFAFHWDILWKFSCYCMHVTQQSWGRCPGPKANTMSWHVCPAATGRATGDIWVAGRALLASFGHCCTSIEFAIKLEF